jgi:glycosyltransferase involved in cell wall biosynthesis
VNIILINHYGGSTRHGMEFRPFYLAREWVRAGHKVQIVAASHSHIRANQPKLEGAVLDENIEGIDYRWYATPAYQGNGVGRVKNMLSFMWALWRDASRLTREFKPDVVIASSTYPMDIWPARRIAKLARAKLVFEVHDLWPLSPMELGGMSKWHPFILLVQAAENYAYRHADVVISMLPKVREHVELHGMAPHKLHIVPNGVDPDEWSAEKTPLPTKITEKLAKLKAEGYAIVGYAGTHGVANALETLLEAAEQMLPERVAFLLVGGGPEKALLQERARTKGLRNVHFMEPVLKEQIPSLLQWFDVAYVGFQRQPLFRFGIAPNKLMDYMMAGRPVLMAIDAGNDPVSEAACGLTVRPENPQAVVDGVRSLLAPSPEQRKVMGERGRSFVLKNHTYPVLAQQFLDACR